MRFRILVLLASVMLTAVACGERVVIVTATPADTPTVVSAANSPVAQQQPAVDTPVPANDERQTFNAPADPTSNPVTESPAVAPQPIQPTTVAPTVAPTPTAAPSPRPTSPVALPTRPAPTATLVVVPSPTPDRRFIVVTPTPLWVGTPIVIPTATPTSVPNPTPTSVIPPTIVAAAPGDQFEPTLSYQYELPRGWSEVRSGTELVLYDSTRMARIIITERNVDRPRYPTIAFLGIEQNPDQPVGWTSWDQQYKDWPAPGTFYRFMYEGENHGIPYMNLVYWYLWGEVHVEVSAEIPVADWDERHDMFDEMMEVLDSFTPHIDEPRLELIDVLASLDEYMTDRLSEIYGRDEQIRARVELTCQQIFDTLVLLPTYMGNGTWQASAPNMQTVERWFIYEPGGSVAPDLANQSSC